MRGPRHEIVFERCNLPALKAPRFRSRAQRWNRRRAREFGLRGDIMAPIERFFLATTVSGFLGLIASIAWLMVR